FFAADRDEIAVADFALHLEAKALEKALDREVERGFPRRELRPLRSLTWHGYPATRTTGFARVRHSRCCRNHVADVVSASLTRAARCANQHRDRRGARGLGMRRPKRNNVPVVILLRSRIDSVMCRQGALQKARGSLLARERKRLCFRYLRRKDR